MQKFGKVVTVFLGVGATALILGVMSIAAINLVSPVQIFLNDTDHDVVFFPLLRSHQQIYRGFRDFETLSPNHEKKMKYDWESGGAQAVVMRDEAKQMVYCLGEPENVERNSWLQVLVSKPDSVEVFGVSTFKATNVEYQSDDQAFKQCVK